MSGLLRGELWLTIDVVMGMLFADVVMRLGVPDMLMRRILPSWLPYVTGLSVTVSVASSKAGAAILSSSLSRGEISERCALWSVLMLPFPSYLRRWPSTLALSLSMAGVAGGIFAVSLLIRSLLRFMIALFMVRHEGSCSGTERELPPAVTSRGILRQLTRTLPIAWLMFGVAYSLVPIADGYFREHLAGSILPVSGWTVAAASIGHVTAALSLAGGAMSAGELSVTQAVFSLILGSCLGTISRVMRQNAGYYYGLFPKRIATRMLVMNVATITPIIGVNLIFAGIALSLWP